MNSTGVLQERRNLAREIIAVDGIDLRGNPQRDSAAGNRDGPVGTFLRSDPAKKSEIPAARRCPSDRGARGRPMQHRLVPISPGQRRPLRVEIETSGIIENSRITTGRSWQIEPTMQRRQRLVPTLRKQRKVQIVGMKMDKVELGGAAAHPVQHDHVVDERVLARFVEPQGLFAGRRAMPRSADPRSQTASPDVRAGSIPRSDNRRSVPCRRRDAGDELS